ADATAMQNSAQVTDIAAISPEITQRGQISAEGQNENDSVIGATAAYATVHNVQVQEGSFITDANNQGLAKVAVIGPQVASDLFGTTDPIGQSIRISRTAFRVVGVTVSKGGSGF